MANLSCTQFKSRGVTILCVLHLHYNVAFTFRRLGNSWNKTFYSQTAFSLEWAQTRSDVLLSVAISPCIAKYLKPNFSNFTINVEPHAVSSETSPLNENRLNRVWRFNANGSFTFLLLLPVISMCSICLQALFTSRNELGYLLQFGNWVTRYINCSLYWNDTINCCFRIVMDCTGIRNCPHRWWSVLLTREL